MRIEYTIATKIFVALISMNTMRQMPKKSFPDLIIKVPNTFGLFLFETMFVLRIKN